MPAEEVYVFDACAVVALLQGEEGASVASGLLLEESHRCLVHAINACEVYYDLFRRDGEETADGVREVLEGYGFEIVEDLPFSLWKPPAGSKGLGSGSPTNTQGYAFSDLQSQAAQAVRRDRTRGSTAGQTSRLAIFKS